MSAAPHPCRIPPELERTSEGLAALAYLLQCADPDRWNSLARPCAQGLAVLLFVLQADLAAGLEQLAALTG